MPVALYNEDGSPFCMAIRVLAKYIGLELEILPIDMEKGEHLSSAYRQLNPFHAVPTMKDNGLVLFESRAIMRYLVDKYANGNALYPKDVEKRALVEAMLDTDCSVITPSNHIRLFTMMTTGHDIANLDRVKDGYECLDSLLAKRKYAAGDHMTIADISIIHSLCYSEGFGDDLSSYKHLQPYKIKVQKELGAAFTEFEDQLVKLKAFIDAVRKP